MQQMTVIVAAVGCYSDSSTVASLCLSAVDQVIEEVVRVICYIHPLS